MKIKNIPTHCHVSTKKKFWFNINNYRNAHYQVLNKVKRWFHGWFMTRKIKHKKFSDPVQIEYTLWLKKGSDMMNVGSIVDKFMQDALVHRGILKDDNCDHVKKVSFEFAGYSKNGEVTMEIRKYRG